MGERILWVVAVLVVGGAAFFGGQQLGQQTGMQARTQAQQQFFAQRGGGQAGGAGGFGGGQVGAAGGFGGGQVGAAGGFGGGQPVMGTVARVNGESLVLTTTEGTEVRVTLADGGTVRRQVASQLSDIAVGEQVVAVGSRDGDSVEASSIQIGAGFGRASAPASTAP